MRRLVASIAGVCVCLAAASAVAGQEAAERGAKIYADRRCAVCHSIAGKGNVKGPLDEVGGRLSREELRAWIVDAKGMTAKTKAPRKPEMPSYKLPEGDLEALLAYLSTLKSK